MAKLCLPLGFVLAVMISADADNCLGGVCKAFGASSMLQSEASKAATTKNHYAEDVRPPANSSSVAKHTNDPTTMLRQDVDAATTMAIESQEKVTKLQGEIQDLQADAQTTKTTTTATTTTTTTTTATTATTTTTTTFTGTVIYR